MSKEIPLKLISGAARCKQDVVYELPQSDLNFIDTIRNMRPNALVVLAIDDLVFRIKTDKNGNLYFNSAKDPFPLYAIPHNSMRLNFDTSYCSFYPAGNSFPQPIAVGSSRSPGPQSLVFTLTVQPMIPEFKCNNPFTGSENDCNKWSGQCAWRGKPDGCVGGSAYAPYYKWFPPADISVNISRGAVGINSCGINQEKLAGCKSRLLSSYNVIDNTPGTCNTVEMNLAKCKAQLNRLPAPLYTCMSDNYSGGCIQCPPGETCAKVTYESNDCFLQC